MRLLLKRCILSSRGRTTAPTHRCDLQELPGQKKRAGGQEPTEDAAAYHFLLVALSFAKDAEGGVQRCVQPAAVRAATVS